MPVPKVYHHPIKRKDFILSAQFIGDDNDLSFRITFPDKDGVTKSLDFAVGSIDTQTPGICLPSGFDINDIPRDQLVAHLRMGTLLTGSPPGTYEWSQAFIESLTNLNAKDLQSPIGAVKVKAVREIDELNVEIDLQKGNNGPVRTLTVGLDELITYNELVGFIPETQLLVVAGSVCAEYPSYTHDMPNQPLTQSERDDIVAYVLGTSFWI